MLPVFKSAKLVVADSRAEVSSRTRGATASVPAKDVGLRAPAMYVASDRKYAPRMLPTY